MSHRSEKMWRYNVPLLIVLHQLFFERCFTIPSTKLVRQKNRYILKLLVTGYVRNLVSRPFELLSRVIRFSFRGGTSARTDG